MTPPEMKAAPDARAETGRHLGESRTEELRLEALIAHRLSAGETHPLSDLISELGLEGQVRPNADGLTYTDRFRADILQLVTTCRRMALHLLVDVSRGEGAGEPLENRLGIDEISDCFKLRFDHDPDVIRAGKIRFCLVYRMPPGGKPEAICVEAAGHGDAQRRPKGC